VLLCNVEKDLFGVEDSGFASNDNVGFSSNCSMFLSATDVNRQKDIDGFFHHAPFGNLPNTKDGVKRRASLKNDSYWVVRHDTVNSFTPDCQK
jgi:hypothetical protein